MRKIAVLLLAALGGVSVSNSAFAAVDYVRICNSDGAGNLYIPGTSTCLNMFDVQDATYQGIGKANEGVAISFAMPMPFVPDGKTFAITGNWGYFENTNALALSGALKVNDNLYLNGGLGFGVDYGTVGSRAGFMLAC